MARNRFHIAPVSSLVIIHFRKRPQLTPRMEITILMKVQKKCQSLKRVRTSRTYHLHFFNISLTSKFVFLVGTEYHEYACWADCLSCTVKLGPRKLASWLWLRWFIRWSEASSKLGLVRRVRWAETPAFESLPSWEILVALSGRPRYKYTWGRARRIR
jgi:hypothetical protein